MLMAWNPRVSPEDHSTLLKSGCEFNGLQCLPARSAVFQERTEAGEFIFVVEFENEDGSLFVRGPCCGADETDMPSERQFLFPVKRIEGQFRVMDLPVYVP